MTTDRERFAPNAIATAHDEDSGAAIVLELCDGDLSLNSYGQDGKLQACLIGDGEERAAILALGRAIVEALDPVPAPPTTEPVSQLADARVRAWYSLSSHPFFEKAFAADRPLIDAMLEQLDGLVDQPSAGPGPAEGCTCPPAELGTVEYVTAEPHLPLDVEIRTIALDAAVRVIDQTGGSLVEGAAKIERFLRGVAVEEQADAEPASRYVAEYIGGGDGWAVADREVARYAPFGEGARTAVESHAAAWSADPDQAAGWAWVARS